MTTRVGDTVAETSEALRARVRVLQELLAEERAKNTDLEAQLAGARQSVTEEQRAQQQHRLQCRVVRRPPGGWPPIPGVDDVPTGGAT